MAQGRHRAGTDRAFRLIVTGGGSGGHKAAGQAGHLEDGRVAARREAHLVAVRF